MNFLKAIGSWLFDGGSTKVAEVIDEAIYTNQEQAKDSADDLNSARAYEPGGKWDSFVDKWHRAIRPALATWAILILFGLLPPPNHWTNIPDPVWQLIVVIISFYFGGRAILKDLPQAIRMMRR